MSRKGSAAASRPKVGDWTITTKREGPRRYAVFAHKFYGNLTGDGSRVGTMFVDSDGEWFFQGDTFSTPLGLQHDSALAKLRQRYNIMRRKSDANADLDRGAGDAEV
jgi:hypothetical protein